MKTKPKNLDKDQADNKAPAPFQPWKPRDGRHQKADNQLNTPKRGHWQRAPK